MGVEYLTDFAKTLDIFFTGLSECGLLTKYSVQLQAVLVDLELMLKFRNLIWQLIKNLQVLLSKIPALQTNGTSVEVGTQTSFCEIDEVGSTVTEATTELVVACHPITLTAITNSSSFLPASDVLSDDVQNQDSSVIDKSLLQDIPSVKQDKNMCELKPMLVSDDKDSVEVKDLCRDTETSNIVHIVVEATQQPSTDIQRDTGGTVVQLHCGECDRQFKSSGSLERHLQSHSGFCNMCNQVFNCVQSLQDHCRSEHEGVGCFMCTTCGKRFMTKFSYTRHMESHGGKKGAICHVCGKSFSRADYLQTHYTIHVGKRSFACSQCPKKFVRRIQLTSHEKTHSGIKDHVCKMCNRGFARSDKLREHMLRHLNIKRYQCATCKRFYAEKRDLKTHLKVHMKA